MVIFMHSDSDAKASKDLARIYDTRTLEHVIAVSSGNVKRSVQDVLTRNAVVVIPDDHLRYCDHLVVVLGVLQMLRHPVMRASNYLKELKDPAPPASAQVHANSEATGARAALPAGAG